MVKSDYRYIVAMYRQDGTALGQFCPELDWEPAFQWGRFLGIRKGLLSPDGAGTVAAVEPVWNENAGEPLISGLRLNVRQDGGREAQCCLPTSYFGSAAQRASTGLVEKGELKAGKLFRYVVLAYPGGTDRPQESAGAFSVESVTPSLRLKDSRLGDYTRRAILFGEQDELDMPVFIPRRVLDEATDLSRQAGAVETGGILIGHLYRHDAPVPEIFLEVTAQIPAKHTRRELTKLTFTAETWDAAEATLKLRRKDEIMLGWWHSHSYMKETCQGCQERANGACKASAAFMSTDDCGLHRTCFPNAFSIALVVADSPCTGISWALFGWRYGLVWTRGFHILSRSDSAIPDEAAVAAQGDANAAK